MRVERLSVLGFIEGKILAEDVLNDRGALIVSKNTKVNRYIKRRLIDMCIDRITVYCHETVGSFKDKYLGSVEDMRLLLNDLASGRGLDMEMLKSTTDTIYNEVMCSTNIACYLHQLMDIDKYTYTHSINVAFYAALSAKWLGLSEGGIRIAIEAGLLHDVGKIKVPLDILNKKGKLLSDEFDEIKKHTLYGYEMVSNIAELAKDVKQAVLMHHEREDMSGYPLCAGPKEISFFSKIIAVADVFDAMTSDRVYKKGVSPFEAFTMFQTIGQECFDVKIVSAFLKNISAYYTGMNVLIDTGNIGKVVYIPPHNISRPVIRVDTNYLDLARDKTLKILKII